MKRRRRKRSVLFEKKKKPVVKEQPKEQNKPVFSVIKGQKTQRKYKKIILASVLVVILLVILIGNSMAPISISESLSCMSAVSGKGNGFPVTVDGGTANNLYNADSQLLALTDTHLISYNKNGKEVYQRLHGFAKPVVATSAARVMVYDRGGKSYRIENAHDSIYSGTVDQRIISAAMSGCGSYVLVTDSDSDVARATVYNKRNIAVYRYNSSRAQIIGAAINDNGEQIALATLTSKNAVFLAKILVYDIDSTEVKQTLTIRDQLPISIRYTASNTLRVITDKQIRHYTVSSGKVRKQSFGSMQISAFSENEDGSMVAGISADVGAERGKILLLNANGRLKNDFSVKCSISDIAWSGSRVFVLSDKLYTYDNSGTRIAKNNTDSGALCVASFDGNPAVCYAAQIKMFTK